MSEENLTNMSEDELKITLAREQGILDPEVIERQRLEQWAEHLKEEGRRICCEEDRLERLRHEEQHRLETMKTEQVSTENFPENFRHFVTVIWFLIGTVCIGAAIIMGIERALAAHSSEGITWHAPAIWFFGGIILGNLAYSIGLIVSHDLDI